MGVGIQLSTDPKSIRNINTRLDHKGQTATQLFQKVPKILIWQSIAHLYIHIFCS